jgi:hypothetical protein
VNTQDNSRRFWRTGSDWSRPPVVTPELYREAHREDESSSSVTPGARTQRTDAPGVFSDELGPMPTDYRFLPPIADEQPVSHLPALFVGWVVGVVSGVGFCCWLMSK